jgi:hypothetical protein
LRRFAMTVAAKSIDLVRNFFHVTFRPKGMFTVFRNPDWAAEAATKMYRELKRGGAVKYYVLPRGEEIEVTTGRTRAGNWFIQRVMVPAGKLAEYDMRDIPRRTLNEIVNIAEYIQTRIEREF